MHHITKKVFWLITGIALSMEIMSCGLINTVLDSVAPTVAIDSPLNGQTIYLSSLSETVQVTGTAMDEQGNVKAVYVNLNNNGAKKAIGTESWSLNLTVVYTGSQNITVYSVDDSDNESNPVTISFNVELSNGSSSSSSVTSSTTSSTTSSVTSSVVSSSTSSVTSSIISSATSSVTSSVVSSASSSIAPDTTAPTLTITTPTHNQWINNNFTATGTASDSQSSVTVKALLNGYTETIGASGSWSLFIPISDFTEGTNIISFIAVDSASNATPSNNIVSVQVDTVSPIVTFNQPAEGTNMAYESIESGGTINVWASATDSWSGVTNKLHWVVNGMVLADIDNNSVVYIHDYEGLREGTNTIEVTATDLAGNMTTSTLHFNLNRTVLHVSPVGNDTNSGGKTSPLKTIQAALNETKNALDYIREIKVQAGTYTPGNGLNNNGTNGVLIDFDGQPGFSGPSFVISGGWDNTFDTIVGKSILDGNHNVYHVLTFESALDISMKGFVLINGWAHGDSAHPESSGAGAYVHWSQNIALSDIEVKNNTADMLGGGLYVVGGNNVSLSNMSITNNNTTSATGGNGGGIYGSGSPDLLVADSSLYNNAAYMSGGGVYLYSCDNAVFQNNTFSSNTVSSSSDYGSDLYLMSSGLSLDNNVFTNGMVCNGMVTIYSYNNSLVISNNKFFGDSDSGNHIAISEYNSEISGHSLLNNGFETTSIEYLYHDYTSGDISNIIDLTSGNTGASTVSGNYGL